FFKLWSFKIIGLGKNYRQIFEFKGLIRKIFRNKDLASVLKPRAPRLPHRSWIFKSLLLLFLIPTSIVSTSTGRFGHRSPLYFPRILSDLAGKSRQEGLDTTFQRLCTCARLDGLASARRHRKKNGGHEGRPI